MLRRIKRIFGISSRGSYFPNDEVAPADGSVVSTSSRKSTKSEKKSKKEKKMMSMSQLAVEAPKPEVSGASLENERDEGASSDAITITTSSDPSVVVAVGNSREIIIGGEDSLIGSELSTTTTRNTMSTDSLPYRDPSDVSRQFTTSESSNIAPSLDAELSDDASTRSIAGSESTNTRTIEGNRDQMSDQTSFAESVYSTDNTPEDATFEMRMEYGKEMAVDCDLPATSTAVIHSDKSSLCVNTPGTPSSMGEEQNNESREVDETPEAVGDESIEELKTDDELQRRWKEMNDELCDILKKPAPFQVSTARLPPMIASLDEQPTDDSIMFSNEEFDEKNNSVTRFLNESHELTTKSPENKHLRSYGY